MGEILGAGIVSHVPTMVLPKADRLALNDGEEISLVTGLKRMRTEVFDRLKPDTVIVFDTHWYTLLYHCLDSRLHRKGFFTSEELPTNPGMSSLPYDMMGDPELCRLVAELAVEHDDAFVEACDNEHLPVHYGTVNLLGFLQSHEAWVPVSTCQTAEQGDFLQFGRLLAEAVQQLDRRVILLGAGSLSHRFWPLRKLRSHESSDTCNIVTLEAKAADEWIIDRWKQGQHQAVLNRVPDLARFAPEGHFGHYLMMLGALGGGACTAPGEMFSAYESSAGTGQVHMWFERPVGGW